MAEQTKIQWCDKTASPWYGCAHVHRGCDNCYAEAMAKRNPSTLGIWGEGGTRVKSKSFIRSLYAWNNQAEAEGRIVSVFPSLCDPFEDRPELGAWRQEMFAAIDECPHVRLLLLTKRPENICRMWCSHVNTDGLPPSKLHRPNVWLLTSVSDQPTADRMIPELLACRDLAPVLGVSAEPLLGPVDLHLHDLCDDRQNSDFIRWIIAGGESGPNARPCNVDWIRAIRDQCAAASVSCFVKQLGAAPVESTTQSAAEVLFPGGVPAGATCEGVLYTKRRNWLRDPKGGDMTEFPKDLQVREFPKGEA